MEIYKPCCTFDWRRRLIKPNMPSPSNTQNLQINATILPNFLLIIFTKLSNFIPWNFSIRNIDIFWWNVNMIKQILSHIVIITFPIIPCYRIVLVKIECYHIFERKLPLFIHSDQLFVYF